MIKKLLVLFLVLISVAPRAQTLRLSGNTRDTATGGVVPNALLMAVRFADSTLAGYSRTGSDGNFAPLRVPLDTFLVIVSHPNFSDRTFLLVPSENDTA